MNGSEMIVAVSALGLTAFVFSGIFGLIRRSIDARHAPKGGLSAETDARMARIEQAVDAIAVEIERISEGQRFTTRLLSERAPAQLPPAKPPVQS